MARPAAYDWDSIRDAYEKGVEKEIIVKKYRVPRNILTNNINKHNWVVKCDINSEIKEFSEKLNVIAQNSNNHIMDEIVAEKINTQLQDNKLIENNRHIAEMLQNVIVKNAQNIDLKNIKQVSSTLKDIESIANPRPEIAIQNNTQVNTQVNLDWSLIE